MSIHGLRIGLDGRLEDLVLPADPALLADALNTALDSRTFTLVGFEDELDLFVDDEGMLRSEPNPILSKVTQGLGYAQPVLFGPGVFLRGDPHTGTSLSLSDEQRQRVVDAHRAALRPQRVIIIALRRRI